MTYDEMIAAGRTTVVRKLWILPNGQSTWIDVSEWVVSWGSYTEELDDEKLFHINPPRITVQLRNDNQKFGEQSYPGSIFYGCPSRVGSWIRVQIGFGGNTPEDVFRGKVSRNITLSADGLVSLTAVGLGEELKNITLDSFGKYKHFIEIEEVTGIKGVDEYTYTVGSDEKDVVIFAGWPDDDEFTVEVYSEILGAPVLHETHSVDFKKIPYFIVAPGVYPPLHHVIFKSPSHGTSHCVRLFACKSKYKVTNIDFYAYEVNLPAFLDDPDGRPSAQFGICIPDEEVPDPYTPENPDDTQILHEMPFICDTIIIYEHKFLGSEVFWELHLTYTDAFGEEKEVTLDDLTATAETNDFSIVPRSYQGSGNDPHSCFFDYSSRAWKILTQPFRKIKWKVNLKMTEGGQAQPIKPVLPYIDMYCVGSYGKAASAVITDVYNIAAERFPFTAAVNIDIEDDSIVLLDIEKIKNTSDLLLQVAEITNAFIWFDALGNLNAVSRATLGDYSGDLVGASDIINKPANVIGFGDYQEEVENIINQVRLKIYGGKEQIKKDADSIETYGLSEYEAEHFFVRKTTAEIIASSILAWKSYPIRMLEARAIYHQYLSLLDLVDLYTRDNQTATYNAHGERMPIIKRTVDLMDFTSTLTIKKLAGFRLLNDLVMRREEK